MWVSSQLEGKQVYFDSNVFIYAFETPRSLLMPSRGLGEMFSMLSNDRLAVRTSAITKAEVLVHPLRHQLAQLEADYRLLLSGTQGVAVDPVTDAILEEAVSLRAFFGMKLADSIHIASAIISGCDCLVTADKGFLRADSRIQIMPLDELTDT